MTLDVLNVEKVRLLINERGWRLDWVIGQLGVKNPNGVCGYPLLREGRLPKDPERKKEILRKLSKLLGVPAKDLVVTLEARAS